jgi:hypothetical protein
MSATMKAMKAMKSMKAMNTKKAMKSMKAMKAMKTKKDYIQIDFDDGIAHYPMSFLASQTMLEVKVAVLAMLGWPLIPEELTLHCGRREMVDARTFASFRIGGGVPPPYSFSSVPCQPNL